MDTIVDVINTIIGASNTPLQWAYAFWAMMIVLYIFAKVHEKHNGCSKPRQRREKNFSPVLPVMGIATALIYYIARKNFFQIDQPLPLSVAFSVPCGIALLAVGLWLVGCGRAAINGYWGPHIYNYLPEHTLLVRRGIYNYLRHPIYLGQILMAFGTLLVSNSTVFLAFPLILTVMNIRRSIREDRDLARRFPNEWEEYRNNTYFILPPFE